MSEDGKAGRSREETSSHGRVIWDRSRTFYAARVSTSSVAEFAARMRRLEALACPNDEDIPFFNEQIQIASRHGLNYRECLEFIVRERHGGAD